jgi:ketosteroid isomerase-like protein
VTRTTGTLQGDPDSLVRLRQVEIAFHKALTEKQLDVMLSLFADDAVITASGVAYSGRDSLRQFWQAAPPFGAVGHWVSYGPAFRDTTAVTGDRAHMYFECLYIDADTSTIAGHTAVDGTLKNTAAGWVFAAVICATVRKLGQTRARAVRKRQCPGQRIGGLSRSSPILVSTSLTIAAFSA